MPTMLDRYKGTLVGLYAGDALGAPYETWSADTVREDLAKRGGLVPFDYPNPWPHESVREFPKGRPTDDSDHAAALAESLIACGGLNEADLYNRLRHVVVDQVSPLWSGPALGAGKTTRTALAFPTWEESRDRPYDPVAEFPSNGSLMRAAPMALALPPFTDVDWDTVSRMSAVTHRHPDARDICIGYVIILRMLLDGKEPMAAIVRSVTAGPLPAIIVGEADQEPRDPEKWPGRGAAELTLHVALWALTTSKDFRDGVTKAVSIGGDTDTYAAVAGALLGAHYGYEAIPPEWRDALIGRDVMVRLATELYELSHS